MELVFLSAAVCILSILGIMLSRKIASLNKRIDKLESEARNWSKETAAKFTSVELKTTAPPEIIVESETAFQRYQRGRLG